MINRSYLWSISLFLVSVFILTSLYLGNVYMNTHYQISEQDVALKTLNGNNSDWLMSLEVRQAINVMGKILFYLSVFSIGFSISRIYVLRQDNVSFYAKSEYNKGA